MAAGGDLSERSPHAGEPSFVLTLELDGESFATLDALRRRYTPPERNRAPAHVTLFYRLPGGHSRETRALLARIAASEPPMEVAISGVKVMERGVAVMLHAPQLHQLRGALASEWWPWLSDEDKAGFQSHVTIQNNVSAGEAERTKKAVAAELRLKRVHAIGLHLWRYRDGRWEDARLFRFQ